MKPPADLIIAHCVECDQSFITTRSPEFIHELKCSECREEGD